MLRFTCRPKARSRTTSPSNFGIALCLALALALGAGCSRLSASHLRQQPVQAQQEQHVEGRFFRFDYTVREVPTGLEVHGRAVPLAGALPAWADSVDSLSIIAYLCDADGAVLETAQTGLSPQTLPAEGLPFSLVFKRQDGVASHLAFGYRCMFVPSRPPAAPASGSGSMIAGQYVFFASEQAALVR